jgi:hypothetical protein
MRTAVIVLSDPKGGEEALGRVFNALAATYELKARNQDVELVFQGTGTRWTGVLTQADHPAHALFESVADKVAGASLGCAVVFGALESAQEARLRPDQGQPGSGHSRADQPREVRGGRLPDPHVLSALPSAGGS